MDKFFKFVHIEKKAVLECDEIIFQKQTLHGKARNIRSLYFGFLELIPMSDRLTSNQTYLGLQDQNFHQTSTYLFAAFLMSPVHRKSISRITVTHIVLHYA